jgi:hypothetical protein
VQGDSEYLAHADPLRRGVYHRKQKRRLSLTLAKPPLFREVRAVCPRGTLDSYFKDAFARGPLQEESLPYRSLVASARLVSAWGSRGGEGSFVSARWLSNRSPAREPGALLLTI